MDDVISAYETHVRLKGQTNLIESPRIDQVPTTLNRETFTKITQIVIEGMTQDERLTLKSKDLRLTFQAITADSEPPSMGFMLEQYQGVGLMSLATHAEGVQPRAKAKIDGGTEWSITLTLPDMPLHSGTYVWSFYLFDKQGLVILDEWKNHIVFDWISPSLTPGLVRLPHVWG
jgi:lipopolysaccharide transport system ATP-binding protein